MKRKNGQVYLVIDNFRWTWRGCEAKDEGESQRRVDKEGDHRYDWEEWLW